MGRPPKEVFLGLDMPFSEALERYSGVKMKEVEANIAKEKRKKKAPGKAPGAKSDTVISMKDRKTARARRGRA